MAHSVFCAHEVRNRLAVQVGDPAFDDSGKAAQIAHDMIPSEGNESAVSESHDVKTNLRYVPLEPLLDVPGCAWAVRERYQNTRLRVDLRRLACYRQLRCNGMIFHVLIEVIFGEVHWRPTWCEGRRDVKLRPAGSLMIRG